MAWPSGEEKTKKMVSSTSYCYSNDVSPDANNNFQTHLVQFQQGFDSDNPEIYNSTIWKGFLGKIHDPSAGGSSTSKMINDGNFFQEFSNNKPSDFSVAMSSDETLNNHENLMGATTTDHHSTTSCWQMENTLFVEDPSLRCMLNERPPSNQGLFLSLSSCNNSNSGIGLLTFEVRQQADDLRFLSSSGSTGEGFFGKSVNIQQQTTQDHELLGKATNHQHQGHIRDSKYLNPVQELLNEFCSLDETKEAVNHSFPKAKSNKNTQEENPGGSSRKPSLHSLEVLELQKKKKRLLQMLGEVDRRYTHYCNQMRAVVSSFEAMAGNGSALAYSALASKAMSRHFRCLKDGIMDQIKTTRIAMGEKDAAVAPGTTKGGTPRLRFLEQNLRQQRAFQQITMMDTHPWRPQRGLPERSVSILRAWLFEHFLHPYPNEVDKHILARQTGLSRSQVSNWFINARVRLWKPMIEEMYLEETKDHDYGQGIVGHGEHGRLSRQGTSFEDQKPAMDQLLVGVDSECLSSVVNNTSEKNDSIKRRYCKSLRKDSHCFGAADDQGFGAIELDFSSHNNNSTNSTTAAVSYANENLHHSFGGCSGVATAATGVSLKLGLQQDGGTGDEVLNLGFSSGSQSSLFYPREDIEECQPAQFSLLDGEGQSLPYRNL